MGLLGDFLDFLDPDRGVERSWQEVEQARAVCFKTIFEEQEGRLEAVMVEQGWTEGDDGTLYPPGYTVSPITTYDKLEVQPEEEERKWWRFW